MEKGSAYTELLKYPLTVFSILVALIVVTARPNLY